MPHLNAQQLEDLKTVYKHILLDPALLVQAAATRRITILAAYKGILAEVEAIDKRLATLTTK